MVFRVIQISLFTVLSHTNFTACQYMCFVITTIRLCSFPGVISEHWCELYGNIVGGPSAWTARCRKNMADAEAFVLLV